MTRTPARIIIALLAVTWLGMYARAQSADAIIDGGFEIGRPNPVWEDTSTNFGSPICNNIPFSQYECDDCGGPCGPRSGNWYAWFGGSYYYELGSLSQNFVLPSGSEVALLSLWLFVPVAAPSSNDIFSVTVDNNLQFTVTNYGASDYQVGYTEVTIDFSHYADGDTHTLHLIGETKGPDVTNFLVDDVALIYATATGFVRDGLFEGVKVVQSVVHDQITIALDGWRESETAVELVDMAGRVVSLHVVSPGTAGQLVIPAQHLAGGSYLLRIKNKTAFSTERVTVQH